MIYVKNSGKRSIFMYIYVFWAMWYVFFSASLVLKPHYTTIWPALVFAGLFLNITNILPKIKSRQNTNTIFLYLLFIFVCFISVLLSQASSYSKDYLTKLVLAVLFAIVVASKEGYRIIVIRAIKVYSLCLLAVSFVQMLDVNLYKSVFLPLVSQSDSIFVQSAIKSNAIVGLTNGTSQNGLYMTIGFIVFATQFALSSKYKLFNGIISILFFFMTFSTAKRSYSIISIILIILLMGLTIKNRSTLIRYAKIIALMAVLAVVFYIAAQHFESLNYVVNKFISLSDEGDVTNGRIDIYTSAWQLFKQNPISGIGINVSSYFLGADVHNSYLQLLLEFGMLMWFIPLFALLYPFVVTYKFIKGKKVRYYEEKDIEFVTSFLFMVMFLMSAFVAIPVQWPHILMLYIIFQMFAMDIVFGSKVKKIE